MAAPGIPSNVYVQQGNGQVFISWDQQSGATSYIVQRSTDNITFSTLASSVPFNYLDSSVTTGVEYWYKVASVGAGGTSSYSTAQSIVPTISGEMSLGQIRLLAKQEADRVNSDFVTVPEWNSYINQSAFELYDLLTTVYEDYNLAPAIDFATDGTTQSYPLPNGVNYSGAKPFYKLMGVDCGLDNSGNAFVTVPKFDFIGRNRYVYPNVSSTYMGVFNLRYRVVGNSLMFIPTPSGGQVIRLWYIPRMDMLLKDTDIINGVSGWTEYIIVDAAIKALEKEESDTSALMARKMALKQRIEESAMNRDAGQPDTISSVRRGGGPGWDGSFGGF